MGMESGVKGVPRRCGFKVVKCSFHQRIGLRGRTRGHGDRKGKKLDFQALFVLHFRRMIYNPCAEGS